MTADRTLPWYRRCLRWGQTNLTEDDPSKENLAFWRGEWKRKKIDGIIVNAGGIVAYYPSEQPLQYRAETLGGRDLLGEWVAAAREDGIAVVARMDINRATEEFYTAHPDWFTVDREGRPYMSQGRYFSCVNSGYYKTYIPEVLTEIIRKYRPDGFTDNSWKGLGKKEICYCENCRKKFFDRTGLPLPEAPDWSDPVYRAWVRFSYDCRTENWDLFNEVTTREGGPDCLWAGMLNANPMGGDSSFGDMEALLPRSRVIFSDHQSRDRVNGFEQNAENGNLLRLASFESIVVPESMANYVRWNRTFRLAADPAAETQTWMWSGIAGGISPWYHHIGSGRDDRRQYETPLPVFQWHAEHEEYLVNRKNLARAALVWSRTDADFYGRENPKERVLFPYRGFASALHNEGIPFLPLRLSDLARYRDRVDTLILPDLEAVTEEELGLVLDFVNSGGNLVFSGNSCGRDAEGEPRSENPLLKRLGLRLTGRAFGSDVTVSAGWETPSSHSYLMIDGPVPNLGDTDIVPFGGCLTEAESDGTLTPFGGYIPPFPIYPPEFAWIRERRPDIHPVWYGELPSGGRVVWFAADLDRCCGRDRLPDHMVLLGEAVKWACRYEFICRVESAGNVDVNLYEQPYAGGTRRILHLTNLSGMNAIGYADRVIPLHDLEVSLPARGASARVRALNAGFSLSVPVKDGACAFTLPRLSAHEALVIEEEGVTR